MERLRIPVEPYANDPAAWGVSLVTNAELLVACLDAAGVRSVAEVGAYAGDLTRLLADWAATVDGRVQAIDPVPQPQLVELSLQRDAVDLVRSTSLEALRGIELPDAMIIDGDHNWWTVTQELKIILERSGDGHPPLLLFHDVCWPHARRDDYYAPEQIPDEFRQPTIEGGGLHPSEPGVADGGLPYRWPAAREGGPRNGVLTAIEDTVSQHAGLRHAVVPSFYGLGAVWHEDAPWAGAVAEVLAPYDRNPVLERLEHNRVLHLVNSRRHQLHAEHLQAKLDRQEELLRKLLESGAFSLAEQVSRLRQRGEPAISKAEIRRVLED